MMTEEYMDYNKDIQFYNKCFLKGLEIVGLVAELEASSRYSHNLFTHDGRKASEIRNQLEALLNEANNVKDKANRKTLLSLLKDTQQKYEDIVKLGGNVNA